VLKLRTVPQRQRGALAFLGQRHTQKAELLADGPFERFSFSQRTQHIDPAGHRTRNAALELSQAIRVVVIEVDQQHDVRIAVLGQICHVHLLERLQHVRPAPGRQQHLHLSAGHVGEADGQ
jgi:hypothetical protein